MIIRILLNVKFKFEAIRKKKILIYKDFFGQKYSEKECNLFNFPKELNIPIFFKTLLKHGFEVNYLNYLTQYIKSTDPDVILTSIDNDINFYKLKKKFKKKIFIAAQNGFRSDIGNIPSFFTFLKQNKYKKGSLSTDYLFCFSKSVLKQYKKYINIKNHVILGSFRNNLYKIKKSIDNSKLILISQYKADQDDNFNLVYNYLINLLIRILSNTKIKLAVILRENSEEEIRFFKRINNKILIIKKNNLPVYKVIDRYKYFVNIDGSLGYETLSRGKRVIFLNIRKTVMKKYGHNISYMNDVFGWPYNKNKKGKFFTDSLNYDEIKKILFFSIYSSKKKWSKSTYRYSKNILPYSYKNISFYKLFDKIIKNYK